MINVNQITAQLARMPDQALQQYAQMHKDDPYTLSLALAESNRRKQTRQGAQMGGQEQPKVVDQELQSMAAPMPEDVGIGQLPAGDMNFADGGIVAFSGGGASKFDPTDAEELRKLAERRLRAEQLRAAMSATPGGAAPAPGSPGFFQYMKDKLAGLRPAGMAGWALGTHHGELNANEEAELRRRQAMGATVDPTSAEIQQAMDAGAFARPPTAGAAPTNTAPNTGIGTPRPRVPPTGGPGAAPAAAAPGTATAAATAAPNLDAAALMETALRKAEGVKHPYAQELGDVGQAKVKAAEEKVAGLEAIHKQFSDIYKGRRERLDTKEAELGKLKDQGTGLAFLQAGAAMMSTPGSFGTALGKSVKVGTEQYAAGLDKLRAAQEKLSDARDRLEETEAQRGELSARELFKARSEVKDVGISVREDLIKANMQMYGLKREEAIKLVEQQIKVGLSQYEQGEQTKRSMFEQSEATKRTQITAGAQLGLLRAIANDPKLQAIYGKGQGQNKIMDEFNDFMKANPQYLTNDSAALQAFLRTKGVLSSLGGASAAPASGAAPGPVLPRKD